MSSTTQIRKSRRSSVDSKDRGPDVVAAGAATKRSKGEGRRSSLGGASNGVRSPRTLAAVAESVAMALAGNVGWRGRGGKQEAMARQAAAQAQLRSGHSRASRRRSSAAGGTGDRASTVVVPHVPRHAANAAIQRQRRERELEEAAQARQLRQALLVEGPLHMGASRTLPASKSLVDGPKPSPEGKEPGRHRPSLAATSRDTLTQVYGGRGTGPRTRPHNRGCSRSLPPPKGRTTSWANKRPDGRCTPFSEGCVSPRDDLEIPPLPPRKRKESVAPTTAQQRRTGPDKGRPPLRKRLRQKALDKAAKLGRALASSRSRTVLQEEEGTQNAPPGGRIDEDPGPSYHELGSSSNGDSQEEELSPLITSISLSTPAMKEEAIRLSKRTVGTNTSPPRRKRARRPSPPAAAARAGFQQQEEEAPLLSTAQSEVSNSLRDAARAHGLTITNLGGLRDNSLQHNSSTSPLHWSQASEEFLGTFCSAHGLTLVNIAHSFPSPSSPEVLSSSLPATTVPTVSPAAGLWQPQERPLRYPRPEPDTSPQDMVIVDRTAASVTPGSPEEVSDYLEGPDSIGRSHTPIRVDSSGSSDGRGGLDEDDIDADDGMRVVDIVTSMRSAIGTPGDQAGVHALGLAVGAAVQANLDIPSLPEPTIMSTGGPSTADSGGLMLVDFNTQRRPPIRISSPSNSRSVGPRQGIGASTMGDTSDILPESLYDSIGISRIDEDPTEEQRQSPSGTTASHCDEELELDHMDRTDELIRLADSAELHRRHHKMINQQVSDALAVGERHSERLARAQKHLAGGVAQPATSINRADGTVQTEREDSMREALGHGTVHVPMGVQTLTATTEPPTVPSVEAIGLQTEIGRMEMDIDCLDHSLEASTDIDQALRGAFVQDSRHGFSYPMWTQTEGPSRGVDQGVQPSLSSNGGRSNAARYSRGASGVEVELSHSCAAIGSSRARSGSNRSSPTYSMVGFEDEEATTSEVSVVQPGSIVASSIQSDISLPFTSPFSDWRSASSTGRGPGSADPEEASILTASAALEGHLNLTYRNLRNERSTHGGEANDAGLRSSHTSLYESRLSNSPSSSMSILTEFTVDGGNNVSVEEVSGALARRRRKAEADVEERIRSSREKMAAGKERDIASPQKRRREHRRAVEERKRRRREAKDSFKTSLERFSEGLMDSRGSSGSSTDSLSIIIRDAERRLLAQQQRLKSRSEAVAKDTRVTEDALRDNAAKLRKVEYLKELKKEISEAKREGPPFEITQAVEDAELSPTGPTTPAVSEGPSREDAEVVAESVVEDRKEAIEEPPVHEASPPAVSGASGIRQRSQVVEGAAEEEEDEAALVGSDEERKSTASITLQRIHAVEAQNEEDSQSKLELVETLARLEPSSPAVTPGSIVVVAPEGDKDFGSSREELSRDTSDSAVLIADPVEAARAVAEAKVPSVWKEVSSSASGSSQRRYESSSEQILEVARFDAKPPVVSKKSAEDLEIDKMEVVEEAPVQSPELVPLLPRPSTSSSSSRGSPVLRVEGEPRAESVTPIPSSDALLGWARALPKTELDQCIDDIAEHVLESLLDDRALERRVLSVLGRDGPSLEDGYPHDADSRKLHRHRLATSKAAVDTVVKEAQARLTDREELDSTALKGGNADASALAEMQYKVPADSGYTHRLLWESCLELARQPSDAQRTCALWSKRFPGTKSPLTHFVAVVNSWSSIQQQLNQILEINSDLRMRADAGLHHSEVQQAEERRVDGLAMGAVSCLAVTGVTALYDWSQRKRIRSRILVDVDEEVFAALVEDFALELRDEYEEGGG
ncbi:hypothetical protein Pmar_PMAR027256 [Perkinsus marinus ATCC 50983]|uniref:Uncharacterized protein n=2 Tax=Perkinsus marinus (strain ATCC 50983 / TXsc) TaxID=423536 RepID=C5LWZ3_PERM5|nr:hypothetical protein Pmar_PMAR027256 [Perkinsus marinus ATCC 50983]EEQ98771.1 hypothetical protein Pmar_PMAR027256 [Perkinsus marinus ATCC 50983]|eukprot:XP_002766054.1 hypothetical protein Pmar_PMAR027256 [Perkinsus marinus ATCC 50983]